MKILHVIAGLRTGGAEVMLTRLCHSLSDSGVETRVVCLGVSGPIADVLNEFDIRVDCLGLKPGWFTPQAWYRLRSLIRSYQPNVVHGWMYHGSLAALTIANGENRPALVMGVHYTPVELKLEKIKTRVVIHILAALSSRFGAITYVSRASKTAHEEMGYDVTSARIIPNGFDVDKFEKNPEARLRVREELGISLEKFVIGHVARYHPMKDHVNLFFAAARFLKKMPDAVFLLVGEGTTTANTVLVDLANELGIHSRIRFCGSRNDVAAVNAALDVACSSSYGESFPLSLGEAMACSVPCVATDVGDVREIIGEAGFVVPPRDPQALCDGWLQVANMSSDKRNNLGRLARQRIAEHYSLRACADAHIELYQQLMADK